MNTVIKLDESHRDLFYNFVEEELSVRNLLSDPLWNTITFANEHRDIFAILEDNQIQMCIAIEYIRSIPWCIHNTLITHHSLHGFKSIKLFKQLYNFIFNYTEEKGIWSHWYARNEKIEHAIKNNPKEYSDYKKISKYGAMLASIVDEKYHIADRAYIKAGNLTGVDLYDRIINNTVLPYDVTIRQLSLRQSVIESSFGNKITYG